MSNKEIFEAINELAKQLDGNTAGIIVVGAYDTEGKDDDVTGHCMSYGARWRIGAAIVEDPQPLKCIKQAAQEYSLKKVMGEKAAEAGKSEPGEESEA